ncbi:hypothetical protein M4D76_26375, partial [Peribacillus frigoritolerans]|nr:hypothetical protein [Peribacillus frigoritolerans]
SAKIGQNWHHHRRNVAISGQVSRPGPGLSPYFCRLLLERINNQTSRVVMIHERVGDRVPVMGVGMLRTPDEVMKAFEIL